MHEKERALLAIQVLPLVLQAAGEAPAGFHIPESACSMVEIWHPDYPFLGDLQMKPSLESDVLLFSSSPSSPFRFSSRGFPLFGHKTQKVGQPGAVTKKCDLGDVRTRRVMTPGPNAHPWVFWTTHSSRALKDSPLWPKIPSGPKGIPKNRFVPRGSGAEFRQ